MAGLLTITALGMFLVNAGLNGAMAQSPAPIGHRQPSAASVPQDDMVFVPATFGEGSAAPRPAKENRRLKGLVGFPDICANCNQ